MPPIVTKVENWGNSQGVRLPKQVLEMAHLGVGDEIEVVVGQDEITLRKVRCKKFDPGELVAKMPRGYRGGEDPLGRPVGNEVW